MGNQCNDSNQKRSRSACLGRSDLHRAGGQSEKHVVPDSSSRAWSGGEGPGHGDGMVELCRRQGRFEIVIARLPAAPHLPAEN